MTANAPARASAKIATRPEAILETAWGNSRLPSIRGSPSKMMPGRQQAGQADVSLARHLGVEFMVSKMHQLRLCYFCALESKKARQMPGPLLRSADLASCRAAEA